MYVYNDDFLSFRLLIDLNIRHSLLTSAHTYVSEKRDDFFRFVCKAWFRQQFFFNKKTVVMVILPPWPQPATPRLREGYNPYLVSIATQAPAVDLLRPHSPHSSTPSLPCLVSALACDPNKCPQTRGGKWTPEGGCLQHLV